MGRSAICALVFAILIVILAHMGPICVGKEPAKPAPAGGARNILFLMDVSGSMGGEKIKKAKDAIEEALDRLPQGAVIGLRTFNQASQRVVLPSARGEQAILDGLPGLSAGGGTDIGGVLYNAGVDIDVFEVGHPGAASSRAPWTWILVSDGEGNNPSHDLSVARQVASRLPQVVCHTIGIELSFVGRNELEEIARIFNGQSQFVGREGLARAVRDAVSLAGFTREDPAGPARDSSMPLAGLLAFLLMVSAVCLKGHLSENWHVLVVSSGAGAMAWLLNQILMPHSGAKLCFFALVQNCAYFMLVGLTLGIAMAASEGLFLGERKRAADQALTALPIGIFGGAFAGVLGQTAYSILRGTLGYGVLGGYLPRIIGWAAAGALIGICPGAALRSKERMQNGALGGLLGGAIGGMLFEYLISNSTATAAPRLAALVSTAATVGFMVLVIDALRKQAWLVILEGGPEGKMFIIAKPETTLGSHYKNDVCVASIPGEGPCQFASLIRQKDGYYLKATRVGWGDVNGRVLDLQKLRHGDRVRVGGSILEFQLREPGESAIYAPSKSPCDYPSSSVPPVSRRVVSVKAGSTLPEQDGIEWAPDEESDGNAIILGKVETRDSTRSPRGSPGRSSDRDRES